MTVRKPTFLFVGPDKTGSSWMFNILSKHPECYVPPAKDIYFFDRYFTKGTDWYYKHFFNADANAVAIGELSHDYLFSDLAADRIQAELPNVQILICLRNPIERSLSQFQYLRRGGEVGSDFFEAIQLQPKIVSNSRYLEHLERYFSRFSRDQIEILFFDDLQLDPAAFGRDLLERIGIDPTLDLPFDERVRESSMARNALLSRSLKKLANAARALGLSDTVGRLKSSSVSSIAYRSIREEERTQLSNAEIDRLWSIFEPDIPALSDLVERDLSHWKRPLGPA